MSNPLLHNQGQQAVMKHLEDATRSRLQLWASRNRVVLRSSEFATFLFQTREIRERHMNHIRFGEIIAYRDGKDGYDPGCKPGVVHILEQMEIFINELDDILYR